LLICIVLVFASTFAQASYVQFCRLDGKIVSPPAQSGCCVEFQYLVITAEPYTDSIFGEGWDGCDEYIGKEISVQITPQLLGDEEYSQGQRKLIWRDAVDMEVNGEMCTVVGFSGVEPAKDIVDKP
jgi:hypothetical protein